MVAMLLFSVGGLFSVYEGIHKFNHPEPVEQIGWGVGVLLFALILEGYSTYSNIIEINKRRKNLSFFKYISGTKESDLIVVFGENSAAVIGLVFALIALIVSYFTHDGRYDAVGSIAIGVVLIGVAIFLSIELKSLLIGESASPEIISNMIEIITADKEIEEVINYKAIQQGPGEVLVCVKIKCIQNLSSAQLSILINRFEEKLRAKSPEVKWIYVELDLQEWKS
jgi:divalent metal cation (Fe/Co/Zn/Cd) transporter